MDNTIVIKNLFSECKNLDYEQMNNFLSYKDYCKNIIFKKPDYNDNYWSNNIDENKLLNKNTCKYVNFDNQYTRTFNYNISSIIINKKNNESHVYFILNGQREDFDLKPLIINESSLIESFDDIMSNNNEFLNLIILIFIILVIIIAIYFIYKN